jgi:hypothetical protein
MDRFRVDKETYRHFYRVFRDIYYEKYFPNPDPQLDPPVDSPEIWKGPRGVDETPLKEITKDSTTDVDYFYKKQTDTKERNIISVLAGRLGYALVFIGIRHDGLQEDGETEWIDILPDMLIQFKRYYPHNKFGKYTFNKSAIDSVDLEKAKHCVEQFYHHLAAKETKEAWGLLTSTFQNREVWDGDYSRFHDGYATTLALRQICAFNAQRITATLVECMVFYEDEVSTYPIKGLQATQLMSVGELDDFVRAVKKMQQDIESKGGHGFEKVPLKKLFDPTGMEFIWYECGFKGSELHRHFAKPHPEVVLRLFQCTCTFQGDRWLINNISPAKTYSIR